LKAMATGLRDRRARQALAYRRCHSAWVANVAKQQHKCLSIASASNVSQNLVVCQPQGTCRMHCPATHQLASLISGGRSVDTTVVAHFILCTTTRTMLATLVVSRCTTTASCCHDINSQGCYKKCCLRKGTLLILAAELPWGPFKHKVLTGGTSIGRLTYGRLHR
jgi:hypothetical protein